MILGFREEAPDPDLIDAIGREEVAGLLWFRSALGETVAEAKARMARVRALWRKGSALFICDEEGGLIQQLSGLIDEEGRPWPRLPSPRALGLAADSRIAFAHGREIGRRMRILGLDATLAPTVDLDPGLESPVLGTRCFGDDPIPVTEMALAWLRGLASAGVRGCVKHYPGHGATRVDSHHTLPRIPASTDFRMHLAPYERIGRLWNDAEGAPPAVLTAHIMADGWGSALPASLDPERIAGIPSGLGPVFTDSLDMGALRPFGDLLARGDLAVRAGSDWIVVGIDRVGGLALARALSPELRRATSHRAAAWLRPRPLPPIPEPWSTEDLLIAAGRGLRLLVDRPIPLGEWDWVLPSGFGAYGVVAAPPCEGDGLRHIARVIRYDGGDPSSLAAALIGRGRPVLVGWAHRGPPDRATLEVLRGNPPAAIAHLLDEPGDRAPIESWTILTCGFGEGEIVALERFWKAHSAPGLASGLPHSGFAD